MSADSLYTSMAGLQAITANMQATASNLANVQTTGYSAVQTAVEAAPYTGSNAPGGADAVALTPNPDLTAGPLQHTGSAFDVAVNGDAWLEVQTPTGNAISRNGSLQVTNAGILADNAGNPVLSTAGQPISLPQLARLEIGSDGTVSGVPANSQSGQTQVYGQINIVATPPGTLTPLSGAMFSVPAGAALAARHQRRAGTGLSQRQQCGPDHDDDGHDLRQSLLRAADQSHENASRRRPGTEHAGRAGVSKHG